MPVIEKRNASDVMQELQKGQLEMDTLRQQLQREEEHKSQLEADRERLLLTVDERKGGRDLLVANDRLLSDCATALESLTLRISTKAAALRPLAMEHQQLLAEETRAKETEDVLKAVAADSAALAQAQAFVDEAVRIFKKVLADARRRTGWVIGHGVDRSKFSDPENARIATKALSAAAKTVHDAQRTLEKIQ